MQKIDHNLDEELAIRLLGWKWISFIGIPVRDAPDYPKKVRVRQLFSKAQLEGKDWQEFARKYEAYEPTGNEPLAYAYCSSQGPAMLPKFTIFVGTEPNCSLGSKGFAHFKKWSDTQNAKTKEQKIREAALMYCEAKGLDPNAWAISVNSVMIGYHTPRIIDEVMREMEVLQDKILMKKCLESST